MYWIDKWTVVINKIVMKMKNYPPHATLCFLVGWQTVFVGHVGWLASKGGGQVGGGWS